MEKITIDMGELIYAFESCSLELHYFLDIEKSELIFISEYSTLEEEKEELYEEIESNPERYVGIPEREPREGYEEMVDFVDTVKDENLREKLEIALDGKGAFRRFKDVLLNYPEERQRWFKFREDKTKERVQEWLKENDLEIALREG